MQGFRSVSRAAWLTLVGALASGPLGIWIVQLSHPQPPWRDAATFVAAYHVVQSLPYFFGFLLVVGFVSLIVTLHAQSPSAASARTAIAVPLAGAFAAMIFVNYAIQTTFIPALVDAPSDGGGLLAALTMSNPRSLGWALEMWGYAVLGVATWLVAPAFGGSALEKTTRRLFVLNGPVSVAGGLATAFWPGWVMTPAGYIGFAVWNVLIVALAVCTLIAMRARERSASP